MLKSSFVLRIKLSASKSASSPSAKPSDCAKTLQTFFNLLFGLILKFGIFKKRIIIMAFQKGMGRGQSLLFPLSLDEMISAEHPVRIIDLFIQSLDLGKLGFVSSIPASGGRPANDPKELLKLYL
ncbi:MAG TPA: hypothetical protein PLO39_12490 [Saprospiraceae bacterium]|nr:hypothetical protein [Saprospiraceae bacterium]